MPIHRKGSFCSYCGQPFAAEQPWPRRCAHCGQISFRNPLPVNVVLVPVDNGLLAVRRAHEPARGQLALPGGFIELSESWQEAGARELQEETGLSIDPASLTVFRVYSAPDGTLLIFGLAPAHSSAELPPFTPAPAASERVILTRPVELAFALHTRVAREYFEG